MILPNVIPAKAGIQPLILLDGECKAAKQELDSRLRGNDEQQPGTLDGVLVLLDLHMPGNHGLAGLAAVRAQHPGVAVVVSANDDPRVVLRELELSNPARQLDA